MYCTIHVCISSIMFVVSLREHCLHIWQRLTWFSHYYRHGSSLYSGNLIVCSMCWVQSREVKRKRKETLRMREVGEIKGISCSINISVYASRTQYVTCISTSLHLLLSLYELIIPHVHVCDLLKVFIYEIF